MIKKFIQITVIIFIIFTRTLYPGITGKIAGRVTDAETRMPLSGVNIVLSGTTLGAATDQNGYYTIL
ncbi:MAG: carboxypeptidase-like regulatory domain-containing protein, partial [Candidatus Marinimicrobia bacterium]|nr:carboxypeptidase-like regulatory domain-containing protein [Candidatus Neomarinimicrobiota bacterium]